MKTKTNPSLLSVLILCMLRRRPQSGYAVCRNIETMPIGAISASPGSIYPCLGKLEESGLILTKVVGGAAKPRREFKISARGKRVLEKWFAEPIDAAMVMRSPETLYIRLSFYDSEPGELSLALAELSADLMARRKELQSYIQSAKENLNVGGLMALELSTQVCRLFEKWSVKASMDLQSTIHKSPTPKTNNVSD